MKHFLQTKDHNLDHKAIEVSSTNKTDMERSESKIKWGKLTLTTPKNDFVTNSTFLISGTDFKIGRAPTNDLVLTDQRLSSLHARITQEIDD